MKRLIPIAAVFVLLTVAISAQEISNDTVQTRINSLDAEKSIALTFDEAAKTTKIMAVSENFSRDEAGRSGILAMNFAVGIIYPGNSITKSPASFLLTFWVLSKKPRFGANHSLAVSLREEILVIGSARYAGKPREQMEYLNFEISREALIMIAGQTDVRFHLGDEEFTFTRSQMKLLADLLTISQL